MPQTCPNCLWISSDEADECERCGQAFDGKLKSQVTPNMIGGAVTTLIGVVALGVLGAIVVQRYGNRLTGVQQGLSTLAENFYVWLLGPNEIFKPYIIIALIVTVIVWIVLFILARIQ